MKVVMYCSVSSTRNKSLLAYQEEVLNEFAESNGWTVEGVFSEVTDSHDLNSYVMQKLFHYIRNEVIDVVLIYSKKRICIHENLYEEFEMMCKKHHVQILVLNELDFKS